MTNRMDNLQVVFDRTDWTLLAKQQRALVAAYDETVTPFVKAKLGELVHWLTAVQDAAQMDGYQVQPLTEDEETT